VIEALDVLYRDDSCAVVNKPNGLMAHASSLSRGEDDFLLQRLREQFQCKIHLIHRLDRATSGCVLIAFDTETASALGKLFMSREVQKDYLAICRGWPEESFTVDYALDGGPGKPEKKPAITEFKRLATAEVAVPTATHESSRYALMLCSPYTGDTMEEFKASKMNQYFSESFPNSIQGEVASYACTQLFLKNLDKK
jgi:tRNA pseudouridine65 synthase